MVSGTADTNDTAPTNPAKLLLGILVGAFVLGQFGGPLADWIGAIGTAAHEAGHAAVADVLTGRVASMTVFRDGGGVTFSQTSDSDWRTFLVSAAGYPTTLITGLALLTGVLIGRSSRPVAIAGAVSAIVALILWTPFDSVIDGISDGDQRFTWFVLLVSAALLAAAAAIPDRHDGIRRVVLGILAVGLLSDAFRAGRDLVVIEDLRSGTTTDADGLAEASGILSAGVWAWLMRLALFVLFAAWGWLVLTRWARRLPAEPSEP